MFALVSLLQELVHFATVIWFDFFVELKDALVLAGSQVFDYLPYRYIIP